MLPGQTCLKRDFVSEGGGFFHTSQPSEMAGVTSGEHSLVPRMDSVAVWEEGGGGNDVISFFMTPFVSL